MREPTGGRIAWIDTETTGTAPEASLLLELAIVVTDADLNELGEYSAVIKQDPAEATALMNEYVKRMHTSNGLLDVIGDGVPADQVEQEAIRFLSDFGERLVVGGSSIGFDRAMLHTHMPTLNDDTLHYRNIDVSSIRELARNWRPEVIDLPDYPVSDHRALGDIRTSIWLLNHFRKVGFIG